MSQTAMKLFFFCNEYFVILNYLPYANEQLFSKLPFAHAPYPQNFASSKVEEIY